MRFAETKESHVVSFAYAKEPSFRLLNAFVERTVPSDCLNGSNISETFAAVGTATHESFIAIE